MSAFCLFICLFFPLLPLFALAAQSTKDVPATEQLKEKTRQEILAGTGKSGDVKVDYQVGVGDILGISVYGEGDMAVAPVQGTPRGEGEQVVQTPGSGVQVRIDGKISLKHIGDIEAVGLTLTQLADYLKVIYATVFDDPVVTTVLVQSNSQRYTVMGKVTKPGVFHLDYPINIVQAVARAGGFDQWANSDITLVRKDGQKDKLFEKNTLEFDYDDFLKGQELERNVLIQPGDILIVH
jgi:polysaccharide export outer membrane protein